MDVITCSCPIAIYNRGVRHIITFYSHTCVDDNVIYLSDRKEYSEYFHIQMTMLANNKNHNSGHDHEIPIMLNIIIIIIDRKRYDYITRVSTWCKQNNCISVFPCHVIKWEHFRVIGPLWRESTGHRWIPLTKPITRNFDVFFYVRLNTRLSKQSRCWWFETPWCLLWHHCSVSWINCIQQVNIMTRAYWENTLKVYILDWIIVFLLKPARLCRFSSNNVRRMSRWLVQIMACHLFGADPINSEIFIRIKNFLLKKMYLKMLSKNGGHFGSAKMF